MQEGNGFEGVDNLQEKLYRELRELASRPLSDQESVEASVEKLRAVYDANDGAHRLRHRYSRIATVIYDGETPTDWSGIEQAARRAQMLSSNLDQLTDVISERQDISFEVRDSVEKLRDHVSLEMQHITVFDSLFESLRDMGDRVAGTQSELEKKSDAIRNEQEEHKAEMLAMRREYIAILGIFAAVVLVVNSGIGFSLSGMEAAVGKGAYPVVMLPLVLLIVGFVVVNAVAILFEFVWGMVQKEDSKSSVAWYLLLADAVLVVGMAICFWSMLNPSS